jgi:hypothetical protein
LKYILWVQQSGPIASGIDEEVLKSSSASIPDAIGPDCWANNTLIEKNKILFNLVSLNVFLVYIFLT